MKQGANYSVISSAEKVRDYYNELVKGLGGEYTQYRWQTSEIQRRHYQQTRIALINAFDRIGRIAKVLEVGCGPAVWTDLYLHRATRVTLCDISEEMLRQASKTVGQSEKVDFICGNFATVELEGRKYDQIISVRAWEYLENKKAAVKKCYNLLHPAGSLLIVTKNRRWLDNKQYLGKVEREATGPAPPIIAQSTTNLISWEELMGIYEEVGFVNVRAYPVVLGSYKKFFNSRLALKLCDIFHRRLSGSHIQGWFDGLVESYMVMGVKGS